MSHARGLPVAGETIANFRVVRLLGQGGHAAVFEALQEKLDRQVALKVLLPHVVENLKGVEKRFLREIDLVKRLEHPNAVRLYDYGNTDGLLWMAVELVKGPELAELLSLHGRIAPQRAIHIQLQILSGLAEAHDLMVIHRDLKPGNIMLTRKGAHRDLVKIVDFGIGKALGESEDRSVQDLTGPIGDAMGSPLYMPPELLKNDTIGPHCDVYAAGLIFAEMLTGEKAFDADTLPAIMAKQIYNDVPMPPWLASSALAPIIRKATAKKWQERYRNALEFHEALSLVDPKSIDAPPVAEVPVSAAPEALNTGDLEPISGVVASRLPLVGAPPPIPPTSTPTPAPAKDSTAAGSNRTQELLARLKPPAKAGSTRKTSHLPAPAVGAAISDGEDTDDERPALTLEDQDLAGESVIDDSPSENDSTLVSPLSSIIVSASPGTSPDDEDTVTTTSDGAGLPDFDVPDEEPDTAVGRPSGKAKARSVPTQKIKTMDLGDDSTETLLRSLPEEAPRRRWGIIVAAAVVVLGVLVALFWGSGKADEQEAATKAAAPVPDEPEPNTLAELVEAESSRPATDAPESATVPSPEPGDESAAAQPAPQDTATAEDGETPPSEGEVPAETPGDDGEGGLPLDESGHAVVDADVAVPATEPGAEEEPQPSPEDLAFLEALDDSAPARVSWRFSSTPGGAQVVRTTDDTTLCTPTPCDATLDTGEEEVQVAFLLAAHERQTAALTPTADGELSVTLEKSPTRRRKPARKRTRTRRRGGKVDPFDVSTFD